MIHFRVASIPMFFPNCYNVLLLNVVRFVRPTSGNTPMLQEYDETTTDNTIIKNHYFMTTLVTKEQTTYRIFPVQISL